MGSEMCIRDRVETMVDAMVDAVVDAIVDAMVDTMVEEPAPSLGTTSIGKKSWPLPVHRA